LETKCLLNHLKLVCLDTELFHRSLADKLPLAIYDWYVVVWKKAHCAELEPRETYEWNFYTNSI
jgi:hypothetical protein